MINYSIIHSILCCTAAQVVGFDSVWGKNKVRRRRRRSPCLAFVIGMVMLMMIYLVMRKRMILFVVTGMVLSECPKKILWIFSPYRPTHILSYKLMLAFTSTLSGVVNKILGVHWHKANRLCW